MTERIYVDRSRVQTYLRCKRARYWEYSAGPTGRGIVPKRISVHLALGLAFHAGVEVLLRRAMQADGEMILDAENNAVQAALGELALHLAAGVEVDLQEQPEKKAGEGEQDDRTGTVQTDIHSPAHTDRMADADSVDSPIIIDFEVTFAGGKLSDASGSFSDFSQPIYPTTAARTEEDEQLAQIQIHAEANEQAATGVDNYLKLELAALVEAMIRAYSRRRLQPLLAEFEVLEVEREGTWKLGEVMAVAEDTCSTCGHFKYEHNSDPDGENQSCLFCDCRDFQRDVQELWWMSRHDGLLLERSTNQLYLLSYKTTGAWDRRKKADAEIDMQGLSEAVDVERRLGEAWQLAQDFENERQTEEPRLKGLKRLESDYEARWSPLVSARVWEWLRTQPSPPRILGVRYEYILKGARRQDKKDPQQPGRYVQDSPLIRAYRSDGITAEDRRWAPSYEWQDATGKTRRIDYRSWKKSAVWELMPIAAWVDMLDQGDYWPGKGEDFDDRGSPVDILADQFVPPVTVYRNEDDLRDWLEQVEAQEVQVAIDVQRVRAAQDEGEKRSLLNRLFVQTRSACMWPSRCSFFEVCYGGEDIRRDPLTNSELYQIREANHPIEMAVSE